MTHIIRLATRKSPLALWQAHYVRAQLSEQYPDITIEILALDTSGDLFANKPLSEIGGKLLFVKSLQEALLQNKADIAVHSLKDLSVHTHPDLCLAAICQRGDPRDTFISSSYATLAELPTGASIGTCSPRRAAQLKAIRKDLEIVTLRGNVQTRLRKCKEKHCDATILAASGLIRLDLAHHIKHYFPTNQLIPAIGQGAIAVECNKQNILLKQKIHTALHHTQTGICITAEKAVNQVLGGDCHTPIAAHAWIHRNTLHLNALVGALDGSTLLQVSNSGSLDQPTALGKQAAQHLITKGALTLLQN